MYKYGYMCLSKSYLDSWAFWTKGELKKLKYPKNQFLAKILLGDPKSVVQICSWSMILLFHFCCCQDNEPGQSVRWKYGFCSVDSEQLCYDRIICPSSFVLHINSGTVFTKVILILILKSGTNSFISRLGDFLLSEWIQSKRP